jgi:hypothetical protein
MSNSTIPELSCHSVYEPGGQDACTEEGKPSFETTPIASEKLPNISQPQKINKNLMLPLFGEQKSDPLWIAALSLLLELVSPSLG